MRFPAFPMPQYERPHDCTVVADRLRWAWENTMICLVCGNPMPRGYSPDFSPITAALVVESWPDGTATILDAVHLGCVHRVPGDRVSGWEPFVAVLARENV